MGYLANLLVKIGVDNSDLNGGMDRATRSVNKFAGDVESAGKRLTVGLTLPIAGLGLAAVKAAGEMEQTKVAFTTLLKSADAAQAHIKELTKFSLVTPYQLEDLTKASRLMMAYGFAASDVVPKLRTIGNAVSALGGGSEMMERVIRSIGEIGTRGKITGEQLRELSRAGIPALEAIANKLGISMAEAQKKVTAGAVDAKVAMDGLMEYMDRRFAGGMEAQSKTMLGAWSNTKEKINLALIDIGNTLLPVAQRMMGAIDPVLDRVKSLAEEFAKLPAPIQNTALALGGLTAALPLVMIALGSTVTNTIAVVGAFTKMVGLASKLAPLLAGPAGVAIGLAAVGIAGYKAGEYLQNRFGSGVDAATESVKRLNTEVGKSVIAGMATHGGAAPNTGGLGKWVMDSSIQAIDSMKKTAGAVVDIDKMLTDAGMATMAERKKNLEEAKALYAAVVKEYGAGSVIAIQALQKVNDAQAQLIPTLEKVKNHAQGLFAFGSKGIESAVLVESIRQQDAELQKFIQDVVKGKAQLVQAVSVPLPSMAGGMGVLFSKATYDSYSLAAKKFYDVLGKPPDPGAMLGNIAGGFQHVMDAARPVNPEVQRINEALKNLTVNDAPSHLDKLREDFDVLGAAMESGKISVDTYLRSWVRLVKEMDKGGEEIDPATKREVLKLEKQYGGQLKETGRDMRSIRRDSEDFFHSMSRGIVTALRQWKGFGNGITSVFKAMGESLFDILFKRLMKPIEDAFGSLIEELFAKTATQAATTQEATSALNVGMVTSDAAVAQAATYASISAIPIVGPAAAPAAAAIAYANVMKMAPLAMFEKGGNVPEDMPAFLHKKEMVLPAELADGMRRIIARGDGKSASDGGVHFTNCNFGQDSMGQVVRQLRLAGARI